MSGPPGGFSTLLGLLPAGLLIRRDPKGWSLCAIEDGNLAVLAQASWADQPYATMESMLFFLIEEFLKRRIGETVA